jgi:CO/xanthine dehydrogenase FAD-binding subunit
MPDYVRPEQPQDALARLAEPGSRPVVLGPRPVAWPYAGADTLVDLRALGLAHVTADADGGLRLGGLASLAALAESPLLTSGPGRVLRQAARLAAQPGLLHLATLAGALLSDRGAPELRLALLALDAVLVVETPNGRAQQNVDAPVPAGALVVEVLLPALAGSAALARVARAPRDLAIVACVARVEAVDGICKAVRLALAGASPRPRRVLAAEHALQGQALTAAALDVAAQAAAESAAPVGDFRGSVEYRLAMTRLLARRALAEATSPGQ